jgi:hypothetical protein
MDEPRIAVFGTTAIQTDRPLYPLQRPCYERVCRGGVLVRAYSYGRLEYAHRHDIDIYVVTKLPELDAPHEWWRRLVPASRVFVSDKLFDAALDRDSLEEAFLDPWRRLYAALRIPWSGAGSDEEAKTALIAGHGVLDGGLLPGYGTH